MSWLWSIPIVIVISFLVSIYETWRDQRDIREYDHKDLDLKRFKKGNDLQ